MLFDETLLKGKLNHLHRCRLRCHRFHSFFGTKKCEKGERAGEENEKKNKCSHNQGQSQANLATADT